MTATPARARPRWLKAWLVCSLPWLLLPACAGLPEFTPGVTHRRDVLLALGEPCLALDQDRVLVHAWQPSMQLLMLPAHAIYRSDAGVLWRTGVALPSTMLNNRPHQGYGNYVVHEFDAQGMLLRRLP